MIRQVIGVDFSGARDAAKRIWICRSTIVAGKLVLHSLAPVADLTGLRRTSRETAYEYLREMLANAAPSLCGLDVPFSLPEPAIPNGSWFQLLAEMRQPNYSPADFRNTILQRCGGIELRRETDRYAKAPFSPINLRMFRQTFYGLAEIIAPLIVSGAARCWPFQSPDAALPNLLEVCPASYLKKQGLYQPYKGKAARHLQQRQKILGHLTDIIDFGNESCPIREKLLADNNGDALDSILCAVIAYQNGMRRRSYPESLSAKFATEGNVYF